MSVIKNDGEERRYARDHGLYDDRAPVEADPTPADYAELAVWRWGT